MPFRRPVIEREVEGVVPASVHAVEPFSRFSTRYALIGDPPSFLGGFHPISILKIIKLKNKISLKKYIKHFYLFSSQSTISGALGASGTSKN